MQSAIFLMGPTASGKTAAAIALAQHVPVEVISVDSALVFRGMDIGTAKPDAESLRQVPHHLIDIIDPTAQYSAAQFRRDALVLMAQISARGRVPLLVGGTMLYFNALQYGLHDLPAANPELRAELTSQAQAIGWPAMHSQLMQLDPEMAVQLAVSDTQRIQRALEVCLISGQPMSRLLQTARSPDLPYQLLKIALLPSDRTQLHRRIEQRLDRMLAQGLVNEVRQLQRNYPSLDLSFPSMRCVGYRQVWQHLAGEYDLTVLREKAQAATRQLAKRQLTWLRAMHGCVAVDCLTPWMVEQIQKSVETFLA